MEEVTCFVDGSPTKYKPVQTVAIIVFHYSFVPNFLPRLDWFQTILYTWLLPLPWLSHKAY